PAGGTGRSAPAGRAARPAGAEDADVPEPAGQRWERVLVRVPRAQGQQLAAALKAASGVLDARRSPPVRVVPDPITLL
ncbi:MULTISPECIES: hypothetical protein, partial [unclassified Frankia]|uniref:hypothetical protein n=1 Tax=unclassified Frankia TaxID=2632575 RepID=UPI004043ED23